MSKCNPITRIIPASFAWIVLLFATGVFFAFPCRYLMYTYTIAIPVLQSIIAFFVTVNFGLATFINPGAIPKASLDEMKNIVSSPTYQDIEIQGVRVRLKWCVTCQFYRPPRCVHCGICDTCIETFDHHCPWVNNCIGRRNYRYFFMFLLWLTIHMVSILSLCSLYMKDHLNNMKQLDTIMTLSVIGIIILLFIPIFGLTGFHIMLITQGLTTNEQVTGKFVDVRSPYNKGCFKNIFYSLCNSPLPRYNAQNSATYRRRKKSIKQTKASDRNETNDSHKLFDMQYEYRGEKDNCALSKHNESHESNEPCGSPLLNRGTLHLSLSEALYAKHSESAYRGKSSRAVTPPVPTRLDCSRRSLPPHNKFYAASTPGNFVNQGNLFHLHKDISKIKSHQSLMFSSSQDPNGAVTDLDYVGASRMYPRLHKSCDVFHQYTYAVQNPVKGLASDTCCLGNQTVDKLQELANRSSVISGQCTDMSVLEVFPKACGGSFQTTPSKERPDGQQLLIAQTPQPPLYLNNCVDCQQVETVPSKERHDGQQLLISQPPLHLKNCVDCQQVPHQCQTNVAGDFQRTSGNRPLSFVKAMEMSEGLIWSDQNFKIPDRPLHFNLPTASVPHHSVRDVTRATRVPEQKKQKSDYDISYEISV